MLTKSESDIAGIFRAVRRRHLRHTISVPKGADQETRIKAGTGFVHDKIAAETIDELVADFAKLMSDPTAFKAECSLPATEAA